MADPVTTKKGGVRQITENQRLRELLGRAYFDMQWCTEHSRDAIDHSEIMAEIERLDRADSEVGR